MTGGALGLLAALGGLAPGGGPAVALPRQRPAASGGRGVLVARVGDAIVKAHHPRTDAAALARRLAAAAHPALADVLLPPLRRSPAPLPGGRVATVWPRGAPLDAASDPGLVPWEAAGELLAALHAADPAPLGPLPAMGGPARAARALHRLRRAGTPRPDARRAVERVWESLPPWCRGEAPPAAGAPVAVCHGDFHLGQLVRHPPPGGPWRLIDVDDLGTGDPAWDLARPAAWYAAGLLPAPAWERLLTAYQRAAARAGSRGLGPDPWTRLDAPARAVTAQLAADALAGSGEVLEERRAFVDACFRIVRSHPSVSP